MKSKLILLILLINSGFFIHAQNKDLKNIYKSFENQAKDSYIDFRQKINKRYADFIRYSWNSFQTFPAIQRPKEKKIRPVIIKDKEKLFKNKQIRIEERFIVPEIKQPEPFLPILKQPQTTKERITFYYYGTKLTVHLNETQKFSIVKIDPDNIAKAWEFVSSKIYNNLIRECLRLRIEKQLCDWGYLNMLSNLCNEFLGPNTNEAELLKAYIFSQSGYQMRLAIANNKLYMLYACQHTIFNQPYWKIDDTFYYAENCKENKLEICEVSFPHEKSLSLYIKKEQLLSSKLTEERDLQSSDITHSCLNHSFRTLL